jgi:hypothetical protein
MSKLYVNEIVEATSGAGVHIPGSVVQVVGRVGGSRVTTGSMNSWTSANMDLTITPKFSDSKFMIVGNQSVRIAGSGVTVARGALRVNRQIASGSFTTIWNTAGHQETMQTRVSTAVSQEFATSMPISILDSPTLTSGQTVTYRVEGLCYNDSGVSQLILWEGTRGCEIQILEIAQ